MYWENWSNLRVMYPIFHSDSFCLYYNFLSSPQCHCPSTFVMSKWVSICFEKSFFWYFYFFFHDLFKLTSSRSGSLLIQPRKTHLFLVVWKFLKIASTLFSWTFLHQLKYGNIREHLFSRADFQDLLFLASSSNDFCCPRQVFCPYRNFFITVSCDLNPSMMIYLLILKKKEIEIKEL